MIVLLSPSKTQDFTPLKYLLPTQKPLFEKDTLTLVSKLKKLSVSEIAKLMSISSKLAELNYLRYQNFANESKPAIFAFQGDVYTDIEVESYTNSQLEFANHTIRILSGLYGLLRPMDLIHPYRLEMKTKLDLYNFWKEKLTAQLNSENPNAIINLASEEYFKAINSKKITSPIIQVAFKQKKGSDYKMIPIYAKKARGTMANFIVKNKIKKPSDLKNFNQDDYKFAPKLSSESELVFIR